MSEKETTLYLLGAGRSGTTLLATILNAYPDIQTVGELHQFFDYAEENKMCSCGNPLNECVFWKPVLKKAGFSSEEIRVYGSLCSEREAHKNIPKFFLSKKRDEAYLAIQNRLFAAARKTSEKSILLDSSKYIGRFLLLIRSKEISVKGVYVVRDIRGVIDSFGKNVQTPKSPLGSILYYLMINLFGELSYRVFDNVIKVRYEDIISDTAGEMGRILRFSAPHLEVPATVPDAFEMPHIVGGNRMKSEKVIHINPGIKWRGRMPRGKQIMYYIAALPFMLVNRYIP